MKRMPLISAVVAICSSLAGSSVLAGELPSYEAAGLPISPVQVGVLGGGRVREAAPAPSSVSPHQRNVLRPPVKLKTADAESR